MSARLAAALHRLDADAYAAVAATHTPALDAPMAAVSRAADMSKLWLASAGVIAVAGGPRGRRAARSGLAAVGVTSAIVNIAMKPLWRRARPDREAHAVHEGRHVSMPRSTSFPSGHAASAFAFATGVSHVLPAARRPVRALAALVAYSRIHTGVHYPGDVVAGALTGVVLGKATAVAVERRSARLSA